MEISGSSSQLSRISSASSVASHDDILEKWFEIDDSVPFDVPKQSLEEILSDTIIDFDDDLELLSKNEDSLLTADAEIPSVSYTLDSPLCIKQLESVSYQLRANYERGGGKANAVAVSNSAIAVGTTRGRILVFNRNHQRLESSFCNDACPVSSLSFSQDGRKLAVAFSVGKIMTINLVSGKIINENSDVVQLGRGILQVILLGRGHRMVALDSGGSVYIYEPLSRFRGPRTKCIFSGARGEVVFVAMIANERAIALISLTKLYIVTFPECRLIHVSACSGPANKPPLIDWQPLDFKAHGGNLVSPVVCVARGSHLSFYRLLMGESGFDKTAFVRDMPLNFDSINLKWVDPFHILLVSPDEKLHLVDISQGEVAEETINNLELVYGTAEFKGLSVGGDVSAALKYLGDSVCYQSMSRQNSHSIILGQYSVFLLHIADQIAQLDAFIKRNEITMAVAYAVDVYTEKIQNKKIGLKQSISTRFPSLIDELLAETTGLEGGNTHVPLLIWSCVKTSHFDLLYNTVYAKLEKDLLSKAQFMEVLDEVVNEGLLEDPPPFLVKDYFEYLISEGHLSQFEAAVIRIPVEKQDIDFAVKECKKNKLYDGLIHLSHVALMEYTFPLEVMLENIKSYGHLEVLSDCQVEQSNKLFLYLQCCLTGQAYLTGSLPESVAKELPVNVYRCLISRFGKNSETASETYPYIRLLLNFDGKQFLDVLFTSSDSPVFTSDFNRIHKLLDIIYEVLLSSKNQILKAHFLVFVTHLIRKNTVSLPLHMLKELIESVLTTEINHEQHPEVESSIIDLLSNVFGLDETHILSLAQKNSHLRVCAYIYYSKRQFIELIECYLNDKHFSNDVFLQIRDLIRKLSGNELLNFSEYVRSSLMRLSAFNSILTAELIVDCFLDWLQENKAKNNGFPLLVYNCFLIRRSKGWRDLTGKPKVDEALFSRAVEHLIAEEKSMNQDKHLVEFIRYWLPIGSLSDCSLNQVVKRKLALSSSVLFEARKLYKEAFETLYNELSELWRFHIEKKDKIEERDMNYSVDGTKIREEEMFELLIKEILRLASSHQSEAAKDQWLLKLLMLILTLPEAQLDSVFDDKFHLDMVISGIIESGISSIESLVDSLFGHPFFSTACYRKFRPYIETIFASCRYEANLLEMTIKCIEEESLEKMSLLLKRKTQRAAGLITSLKCVVCGQPSNKSAFIFSCGHLLHLQCESDNGKERKCLCSDTLFEIDDRSNMLLVANPRITSEEQHLLSNEETAKLQLGLRF